VRSHRHVGSRWKYSRHNKSDASPSRGPYKHLTCTDGSTFSSKAVILASGVTWRTLPADGAERLTGRGVYYGAATIVPGECADEDVYITGAGNSAGQAALALADQGARVTLVARCRDLREKMSQYLVDRLLGREQRGEGIRIWCDREVVACHGDEALAALTIRTRGDDSDVRVDARTLFVFIGAVPHTEWLDGVVARDRYGFVLTGTDLQAADLVDWPLDRPPSLLETSVPGIFAAGDVRHESIKRVASAVGEGSVSVHFVHRYLASL
jgi:thioredoxin reductase (NADPH)